MTLGSSFTFPEMPLEAWRPTRNTLHLYCQVVGKIRLALHPPLNHWWHVPLYVTPRGLSTHRIPYNCNSFEIEFDLHAHKLNISTSSGAFEDFAIYDGLSVADFYSSIFANLEKVGIECNINARPYEAPSIVPFCDDDQNCSYDREFVERFHQTLVGVDNVLEEFRGRFNGKSTPVHMFWHSFDIALTRFSGRRVPVREAAGNVEREAYSHEVISFGFWFGDDNVPAPAFYSYTAPEPTNLSEVTLSPQSARWQESNGSHLALLMYDDVRSAPDTKQAVLDFLESAYHAGAKAAGWDIEEFKAACITK